MKGNGPNTFGKCCCSVLADWIAISPISFHCLHINCQLSSLNDELAEAVNVMNQQNAVTSSILHILERHNGILADYKQEFQKIKVLVSRTRGL